MTNSRVVPAGVIENLLWLGSLNDVCGLAQRFDGNNMQLESGDIVMTVGNVKQRNEFSTGNQTKVALLLTRT